MSSPINSDSSSSGSDDKHSFEVEIGEFSGFIPYDENLEPMATDQEAAEYNARVAQETAEEELLQERFTRAVDVSTW